MYRVIEEEQNDLQRVKLLNTETGEYISIIPELGSNVNEIVLKKGGDLFSLLSGKKSREEFAGQNIYNSAKLSPFPNRIVKGQYEFEGKKYQLPINHPQEGHALHGFIYNKPFEVISRQSGDNYAEVTLTHNYDGSYSGYPFTYTITLIYRLDPSGLNCTTEIKNTGKTAMPLNDGWHPYFSAHGDLEKVKLQLPSAEIVIVDKMIPTGDKETYNRFQELEAIDGETFDTCFALKGDGEMYEAKLFYPDEQITIILWQDNQYKYLQVYTPPDRKSIALEPMTGNVNNFNTGEDLIVLNPNENIKLNYGIRLK